MSFLKRHKVAVALVATIAVIGGAAHFSGMTCCGDNCPIASVFSATTAYAGPGCNSASKTSGVSSTCSADDRAKVSTASAVSTDGKTCTKEQCVTAIMAEKKISRAEAEVVYANAMASGSCHGEAKTASLANASSTECASKASAMTASASGCSASKANAQTASASGTCASKASAQTASASGCTGHATTTATLASATEGKTCDKEACIAKCMAEKGYTRAQAEECWAKCAAAKSSQTSVITTAAATENMGVTREAWINSKVASGQTQAEAEIAAAKAVAAGEVTFVSATQVNASGCSATKTAGASSSCCASKAAAAAAKTEETKPAATTASTTTTSGGNK